MWGQNWGELIWGGAAAVPTIGGGALILLLGISLGVGISRINRVPRWLSVSIAFCFVAVPLVGLAAGADLQYFFSNGTPADADEVNANFDVLAQDSESQDARLSVLESGGSNIEYYGCTWSPCVDSPSYQFCGAGRVMVGIDMPEYGGNEGSCNTNSTTGADDYRIRCCQLRVLY